MVKRAVIPAAGKGTRFLPATKAIPKAMIPIIDKPAIQYVVDEALESGIEEVLIIISPDGDSIKNHFADQKEVSFVIQPEPRGLGAAIMYAEEFAKSEPFAVLLGDDIVYNPAKPAIKQLMDAADRFNSAVIGVQTVAEELVSLYGIAEGVDIEPRITKVSRMVEKPKPSEVTSRHSMLGRYVLTPGIFDAIKKTPPGIGGEIQITDALDILRQSESVYAYDFEGRRYDAGNKFGLLEAIVEYGLRREDFGKQFENYLRELIK